MFDISGRIALVTGSTRGIGLALARGLLEAGAIVVVNSRQHDQVAERVDQLATEFGADRVRGEAFDAAEPDEVRRAIDGIEDRLGPIEILVNNAGTQLRGDILDYTDSDWDAITRANLDSVFVMSREAGRRMAERGHGKIVNITSLQAQASRPGIAPYAATKGAVKMLTRGLAGDLARRGVQVNALGPGYFVTELNQGLRDDERFDSWLRDRTPAARWGELDDLVGTLLYLVSPASDFVNGQSVYVDGGILAVL
ncbi:SDR family oxidoreductase [Schumannella luteola]|uniref:SDR family oxidoreductase n=1 Tax=Schumannella luteola TaxID=472059 RepID=UPI001FE7FFEB|nr:SDR family oxidoreductase [Schumannella luteola]